MGKPHLADPDYLRALIEDEVRLAGLLKYHQVKAPPELTPQTLLYPKRRDTSGARDVFPIPKWRRDWSAAGPLLGKYGLSIDQASFRNAVMVCTRSRTKSTIEQYDDHPDAHTAVMAAIVRTLISCLQGGEESK